MTCPWPKDECSCPSPALKVFNDLFRPGGEQRKCGRFGCTEDARHFTPVGIEPRLPPVWSATDERGWSFLCGKHYDALIQREWDA